MTSCRLLDDFLDQHPDFSYRGARAIIAVTGYQGAFGYRISSDYKAKLGDEAFAQACRDARKWPTRCVPRATRLQATATAT